MTAGHLHEMFRIWAELEEAKRGENGFGGDTAEIYAYRLVTDLASPGTHWDSRSDLASTAAQRLNDLCQEFVERYPEYEVAIELHSPREFTAMDFDKVNVPAFSHRIHLQVRAKETPLEEPANTVAERICRIYYLYGGDVKGRGAGGCLIEALEAVAPHIAKEIKDGHDAGIVYRKRWSNE